MLARPGRARALARSLGLIAAASLDRSDAGITLPASGPRGYFAERPLPYSRDVDVSDRAARAGDAGGARRPRHGGGDDDPRRQPAAVEQIHAVARDPAGGGAGRAGAADAARRQSLSRSRLRWCASPASIRAAAI